VRTVPVSRFAELASQFFPKSFSLPRRAIALDELFGARKSMAFSGVVTDPHRQIQVERAYCYRMGRF
jgi:hypothetical protein